MHDQLTPYYFKVYVIERDTFNPSHRFTTRQLAIQVGSWIDGIRSIHSGIIRSPPRFQQTHMFTPPPHTHTYTHTDTQTHRHTQTHTHVILFSFRISASPESWHLRRFQREVVNDHLNPSDAELEYVIHCSVFEPDRSLLEPDRFLLGPFATHWSALLGLTASRTKQNNIIQKHSLMVTTRRFLSGCTTSRTIMAYPTHITYGRWTSETCRTCQPADLIQTSNSLDVAIHYTVLIITRAERTQFHR